MLERPSKWTATGLSTLVGVFGSVGVGFVALAPAWGETPDAGYLPPMMAPAAEELRVEFVSDGTTFGELLNKARLDGNDQHNLLLAFQEHADPRRLRAGTEVTLRFLTGDQHVRGIDVVVSPDELVRLDRDAFGWKSQVVATPVSVDTLATFGTITSDLWTAVTSSAGLAGMPAADRGEVIYKLAQVFQWQIAFDRQIQTGDSFRLVLERQVRPDGSMKDSRILAAEVVNSGKPFHAIWFDLKGDGGGYYDLAGESLQRPFLMYPVEFRRISSRFSNGRRHPILNVIRAHRGVDFAAASGTEVRATGDGVIRRRGVDGGYGNLVEIQHANGFITRYGHLSRFQPGTAVGARVAQGQLIGFVGMTGLATGPHLHYEMHQNGSPRDPLTLDMPAGDPIPVASRDRWTAEFSARYAMLNNLSPSFDVRVADTGGPATGSGPARN